jgi:hypothetical protein
MRLIIHEGDVIRHFHKHSKNVFNAQKMYSILREYKDFLIIYTKNELEGVKSQFQYMKISNF